MGRVVTGAKDGGSWQDHAGKFVALTLVLVVAAVTIAAAMWSRRSRDLPPPDANTPLLSLPADAPLFKTGFEDGLGDWDLGGVPWSIEGSGARAVLRPGVTQEMYPVALWPRLDFADVDVTVRFRMVDTSSDASAGVVFRARDHRSYYAVRASAVEDNVRLYTMEEGERVAIAGVSVNRVEIGRWYTLRVIAVGQQIQVFLDDRLIIDQADEKYGQGKAGVWVVEKSAAEFDEFTVAGAAVETE